MLESQEYAEMLKTGSPCLNYLPVEIWSNFKSLFPNYIAQGMSCQEVAWENGNVISIELTRLVRVHFIILLVQEIAE